MDFFGGRWLSNGRSLGFIPSIAAFAFSAAFWLYVLENRSYFYRDYEDLIYIPWVCAVALLLMAIAERRGQFKKWGAPKSVVSKNTREVKEGKEISRKEMILLKPYIELIEEVSLSVHNNLNVLRNNQSQSEIDINDLAVAYTLVRLAGMRANHRGAIRPETMERWMRSILFSKMNAQRVIQLVDLFDLSSEEDVRKEAHRTVVACARICDNAKKSLDWGNSNPFLQIYKEVSEELGINSAVDEIRGEALDTALLRAYGVAEAWMIVRHLR